MFSPKSTYMHHPVLVWNLILRHLSRTCAWPGMARPNPLFYPKYQFKYRTQPTKWAFRLQPVTHP
ncbi:hypothetical protein Hdeb2414_s0014g00423381 [Helianthus debilis subsp. tardiflorus]